MSQCTACWKRIVYVHWTSAVWARSKYPACLTFGTSIRTTSNWTEKWPASAFAETNLAEPLTALYLSWIRVDIYLAALTKAESKAACGMSSSITWYLAIILNTRWSTGSWSAWHVCTIPLAYLLTEWILKINGRTTMTKPNQNKLDQGNLKNVAMKQINSL